MLIRIFALLFSVVFFAGCASNPMTAATEQTIEAPDARQSQVVFMRSSFVGSAILASVYDVTNGEPEFVGILGNNTKLNYVTDPGKKVFMVVSEAADFMEADIAASKTYYSIVTPRMGAWKARFSMWPIKNDPQAEFHHGSEEVTKWKQNTQLMANSAKAEAWFKKNQSSIEKKQKEYWEVWQTKDDEQVAKRTLSQEDGV